MFELPPGVDAPRLARIRNAVIGGPWADSDDRELAAAIERQWPGIGQLAGHIRSYHRASAVAAAERGVAGIVFAAAGLPASPHPHEDAQRLYPAVRYVYADPDKAITFINAGTYTGNPAVAAVTRTVRDPEGLLGSPEVQAVIRPPGTPEGAADRPVSVQIIFVAHWWPATMARELVAEYARLLPPGSSLVLTLGVSNGSDASREFGGWFRSRTGVKAYSHSPETVTSWLTDAGLETAGAVDVRTWSRQWEERLPGPAWGTAIAAVGRKPA